MVSLFVIGVAVGLASVAGLRAFLPLGLAGLFALFGVYDLPEPYRILSEAWVLVAVWVIAAVEVVADKVVALERVASIVRVPLGALSGAALFASAAGEGLDAGAAPYLVAGGVIAGVVAVLRLLSRPRAAAGDAGVSGAFLSVIEDLVALVGGIFSLFVPYVALVLVAFVLFFYYRIRRRRSRKYEGLRILGD